MAQTLDAIRHLSQQVQETEERVQGLAQQAVDISQVLNVIRSIAEQTNLLALNAAIEAARAGEQGRGFAVVADEVRALAHRTQTSTLEIEKMISSIQSGTHSAVQAMQASNSQAQATQLSADEAGRALQEITEAVGTIDERNMQIATASEQQAHVAREVDRNLMSIRDLSIQSAAGAHQTTAASSELARLAVDLKGLVARFSVWWASPRGWMSLSASTARRCSPPGAEPHPWERIHSRSSSRVGPDMSRPVLGFTAFGAERLLFPPGANSLATPFPSSSSPPLPGMGTISHSHGRTAVGLWTSGRAAA